MLFAVEFARKVALFSTTAPETCDARVQAAQSHSRHFGSVANKFVFPSDRATRPSRSSRSWPRPRSRTGPFPNGSGCALATPLGTTSPPPKQRRRYPPIPITTAAKRRQTRLCGLRRHIVGRLPSSTAHDYSKANIVAPGTTPSGGTGARPASASKCPLFRSPSPSRSSPPCGTSLRQEPNKSWVVYHGITFRNFRPPSPTSSRARSGP
jgi:hypothetical protein